MANIITISPIKISFEVIETEDNLPSMKLLVKVDIPHPTGNYSYQANDIWFICQQWDEFIFNLGGLIAGQKNNVMLTNMSENFALKFYKKEDTVIFNFTAKELNQEKGLVSLDFSTNVDMDTIHHIISNLNEFEKWW